MRLCGLLVALCHPGDAMQCRPYFRTGQPRRGHLGPARPRDAARGRVVRDGDEARRIGATEQIGSRIRNSVRSAFLIRTLAVLRGSMLVRFVLVGAARNEIVPATWRRSFGARRVCAQSE